MLKGINKQIIEIKCPKSEQFEKIMLFLKDDVDKSTIPLMSGEVTEYCADYLSKKALKKRCGGFSGALTVCAVLCAGLLTGIILCTILL
ncbi:MAG: hypothetical protein QM689_09825 [Oscillospiraceae bacterium]